MQNQTNRPLVLTYVALGGEGKTSLVAKWAADLARQKWLGCQTVFAWSFYHQGADEKTADSSDLFLKEALTVFGDPLMAGSAQTALEKGQRLAHLIGEQRALLILDGVEPLQYAPTSPLPGELKDSGLSALLQGLATSNQGLCVVTTRYSIPDLRAFFGITVHEENLTRLCTEAGVALLRLFEVKGSFEKVIPSIDGRQLLNEFEKLVEDVQGHALTLSLLGSYLRNAHAGDIRKRDLMRLEEADAEGEHGGHAFRVMDAYVEWFAKGGKSAEENRKGLRALAVLQLLGLFDRPATADCLSALLKEPVILNLTEPFGALTEAQRNLSLTRLEDTKLLTVNRDAAGELLALDTHPLLREYFARQLRTQYPDAWRAGHRRLYDHLCTTTKDKPLPTLEDLQPLYQAIPHGFQAGMQFETLNKVYYARILQRDKHYSIKKLGAFGADLGALACFFEPPWSCVSPALPENLHSFLLSFTAYCLRALGRLSEAIKPLQAALEMNLKQKDWRNAAISASNLSELKLTLGSVAEAVTEAEQSVGYADFSGNMHQQVINRTTHANAMHQSGDRAEAEARFCEAEKAQVDNKGYPLLFSIGNFHYCDLLLAIPARCAWQRLMRTDFDWDTTCFSAQIPHQTAAESIYPAHQEAVFSTAENERVGHIRHLIQSCHIVAQRSKQLLDWDMSKPDPSPLSIALNHLTLACSALYQGILESSSLESCSFHIDQALTGLRRFGARDLIVPGLLTRAWLHSLTGKRTGSDSAQSDLNEAWKIAERGPMRLFLADIHLYRARLFSFRAPEADGNPYPWDSPVADLAAARALIVKHGYLRRLEELEEAKAALNRQPNHKK